ncbi:MAG: PadR family transcriptional regulator [Kofleriaceae bacterium]|nr:PadR family transcriptional regulator [Kofleriaceae bacterium]
MNVSKFIVLGALESMGKASGYDIDRFVHERMIHAWTEIKRASIYNALKGLTKDGSVEQVEIQKNGLHPQKILYAITKAGLVSFDALQEEAALGIYPRFYGFKLALKLNQRKTKEEFLELATHAIERIDDILKRMDEHLKAQDPESRLRQFDTIFIAHDRGLYLAEKKWIGKAVEQYYSLPEA